MAAESQLTSSLERNTDRSQTAAWARTVDLLPLRRDVLIDYKPAAPVRTATALCSLRAAPSEDGVH